MKNKLFPNLLVLCSIASVCSCSRGGQNNLVRFDTTKDISQILDKSMITRGERKKVLNDFKRISFAKKNEDELNKKKRYVQRKGYLSHFYHYLGHNCYSVGRYNNDYLDDVHYKGIRNEDGNDIYFEPRVVTVKEFSNNVILVMRDHTIPNPGMEHIENDSNREHFHSEVDYLKVNDETGELIPLFDYETKTSRDGTFDYIECDLKYNYAGPFKDGVATVGMFEKGTNRQVFGVIDMNGEFVVQPKYEYLESWNNGNYLVASPEVSKDSWKAPIFGDFMSFGRSNPDYYINEMIRDGSNPGHLAAYYRSSGQKYGLIDISTDETIIPFEYVWVEQVIGNKYLAISNNKKKYLFDVDKGTKIELQKEETYSYFNGNFAIHKFGNDLFFDDLDGNSIKASQEIADVINPIYIENRQGKLIMDGSNYNTNLDYCANVITSGDYLIPSFYIDIEWSWDEQNRWTRIIGNEKLNVEERVIPGAFPSPGKGPDGKFYYYNFSDSNYYSYDYFTGEIDGPLFTEMEGQYTANNGLFTCEDKIIQFTHEKISDDYIYVSHEVVDENGNKYIEYVQEKTGNYMVDQIDYVYNIEGKLLYEGSYWDNPFRGYDFSLTPYCTKTDAYVSFDTIYDDAMFIDSEYNEDNDSYVFSIGELLYRGEEA